MRKFVVIAIFAIAVFFISACVPIQPMPRETRSDTAATQDEPAVAAKIAVAMRGVGPAISKDATIMDWPTEQGGKFVVLREGANRWTCLPPEDYIPEEIAHPFCLDDVWLAFMQAKKAHQELSPVTAPGVAYMLDGGGGPSITDPFATEPPPGQEWGKGGPHMMILTPGDLSDYSRTPGLEPWVMFPDTSYAHLMVAVPMPVATEENTAAVGEDAVIAAKIAVAMRAAGPVISQDATIMDWPAEPGGEFVVLREGTNRWTCFAPEEYLPEDVGHPICMDDVWLAYMKAKYARAELPPITTPGVAYMLDGGGGPSITDPFATEPPPGQDWGRGAPHMMVLAPGDLSTYGREPGPAPWVMFPDTSYAHLMVAVPMPEEQ